MSNEFKVKRCNRLKQRRESGGLTQEQLAVKVGVTISSIAKIEQGKRFGCEETWKKINQELEGN